MPSGVQLKFATFNYQDGEISDAQGLLTVQVKDRNYIKDKTDFHKLDILGLPLLFKINILRVNKINPIQRTHKWRELHLYSTF